MKQFAHAYRYSSMPTLVFWFDRNITERDKQFEALRGPSSAETGRSDSGSDNRGQIGQLVDSFPIPQAR